MQIFLLLMQSGIYFASHSTDFPEFNKQLRCSEFLSTGVESMPVSANKGF